MAQFRFKLHPVLRQRELVEQERQRDVAAAEAARAAIAAELKRMDETVREALNDLRQNQLVGPLNLSYLAGHRRFMLAMQRQGALVAQKLEAAQKKVDAERVKLAEASKQRRIIEKLRERQHAVWLEAVNRKEIAALDEVAMQMSAEAMREQWAMPDQEEWRVKKIVDVIVLTLALNFLAVVVGTVVLLGKSHMDKEKFGKLKELLFATSQPAAVVDLAATQPAATTEPADRLAELLAKASGKPAQEQIDYIRQTFDGEMAELEAKQRELLDLQHQIDLARQQTRTDRAKLEEAQTDLQNRQKMQDKLASDEGFQKALELYNVMPAKQVKTIFMTLGDDAVQQYLQAMEPRTAAKIIKEFKMPDETARIQKVLERIRQAQPAAADAKPAGASGTPLATSPGSPAQAAAPMQ